MRDAFIPYLVKQLQKLVGEALVVLDSASAHLSPIVLNAFRRAGTRYGIIPGGLSMYIQAIDVASVAMYREEHHALCRHMVAERSVHLHAKMHTLICHAGVHAALKRLNVPQTFQDLGYIDSTKIKLRIPFQFVPPVAPLPAPKPKPKAIAKPIPKQMSIASFFGRR